MPKNWNKLVTIQEAVAAYAAGDDLDAHCFLYAGDRVKPYRETLSGDIITLPPYDPPLTLYTETGRFIYSLIADIEPVQAGTGDPSPDNIRPISGWTKCNVQRTGKNLLENTLTTRTVNGTTFTVNTDGSITISGTPGTQTRVAIKTGKFWDGNQAAIFSCGIMPTGTRIFVRRLYNDVTSYPTISPQSNFLLDAKVYDAYIEINTNFNGDAFTIYPQLELGSIATAYEPYSGQTYYVDWETEAGTVYGGTLDVNTGVLTVDRVSDIITTVNGKYESVGADIVCGFYIANRMRENSRDSGIADSYQSIFTLVSLNTPWRICFGVNNKQIYFSLDPSVIGGTDIETIRAYVANNPIHVVYPLAKPLTYQLTPTKVTLLEGENNIFADTGSITLTYVETREET